MIVKGWTGCEIATTTAGACRPQWRGIITGVRRKAVLLLAALSCVGGVREGRGTSLAVRVRLLLVSMSNSHYAHARAVARRNDAGRSLVGRHGY